MMINTENVMTNVRFDKYCKICQYKDVQEEKDPCRRCLEVIMRAFTSTPLHWKEKEE